MSYWDWSRKGTLRQPSIAKIHRELLQTKGAYWRPYSFYTAMNTYSHRPTGRAVKVHIKRSGNYRTQDKTLCGLIICDEVIAFDYDNPGLCTSCRKVDLAVEQSLLDRLRILAAEGKECAPRTYWRDHYGRFTARRWAVNR